MRIKDKLYKVAAKLFEKKGYPATSIRDIAMEMDLKPSSLYSHIQSKEEILISICHMAASAYEKGMEGVLQSSASPIIQLGAVIDLHVEIAYADAVSITVFNNEWRHLPQPHLDDFLLRRRKHEQQLEAIIQRLDWKKEHDDFTRYFFLQSMLSSMIWLHRVSEDKWQVSKSEIKQMMQEFILSGMFE